MTAALIYGSYGRTTDTTNTSAVLKLEAVLLAWQCSAVIVHSNCDFGCHSCVYVAATRKEQETDPSGTKFYSRKAFSQYGIKCFLTTPVSSSYRHTVPVTAVLILLLQNTPHRWPSGKVSASRAEGPGFESRLRRDFFGVESYL